ncbi:ATP-binding protein, partial [Klebsiella pneumoniae]
RQQALSRGGKLDEAKSGSGLGLSIVTELVELHGGELRLDDSPEGGLRAEVILPLAQLRSGG